MSNLRLHRGGLRTDHRPKGSFGPALKHVDISLPISTEFSLHLKLGKVGFKLIF